MNYPENYKYSKEHEWAEAISDTRVRIGVTHHAQSSLGDIVYLELPKVGRELKAGETFGVIESIKAVSDLYCPISGKVVESNGPLCDDPVKVNDNAHGEWMIVVEASDARAQVAGLMNAAAYGELVKGL